MSNQERIKEYLVGDKGYLRSDISNGKVIMLSGKWGSGKTHFWQNEIVPSLNNEKSKIPNHYISLYGKTSIEEIKSEIFLKVFESVDSFESEEKTKNIVKTSVDIVSSLTKSVSVFGMSLDLSKVTDKSFEKIDNLLSNEKLKRTETYLNSGAIICIDDFERKSKDIDLNDLFGFITQLTLNFNCKIVIILNDDVFEGEEKNIFSNVKEKSVSKFLYFNPDVESQFSLLIASYSNNDNLMKYWELIVKTFKEIELINLRISLQVLENINEWINSNYEHNISIIRTLILSNINFILYHTLGIMNIENYIVDKFDNRGFTYKINSTKSKQIKTFKNFEMYKNNIKRRILSNKEYSEEKLKEQRTFIEENIKYFESEYFLNKFNVYLGINDEQRIKINNFIETGILIDE